MRPPAELDPDQLTVIEIVQHAAEIVSRMPLARIKESLRQYREDDPKAAWWAAALRMVESAQLLELDGGKLSALEARAEVISHQTYGGAGPIPDDWTA